MKRQQRKQPTDSLDSQSARPRRRFGADEWLALAATAAALVLRTAFPSYTTVEHFDEGVYASNLWFGAADNFHYPQQHLYAPPLVPSLIEWTMILTGRIDGGVAMLPSLALGTATIPLLWLLARRVFGPTAAIIAATLASVSGIHILLSRSALTDCALMFWFVLAMLLFESALRTGSWLRFALAGLATGVAWWTKYNGWLPLALSFATIMTGSLCSGPPRPSLRRWLAGWGLASVVATIVWLPHLLSLHDVGGYSAVMANHSKYVVGIAGWPDSLIRQLQNLLYVGSWGNLDLLSLALGMLAIPMLAIRAWKVRANSELAPGLILMLVWIGGLAAMTPLYTPYPRLILPWMAAAWLSASFVIGQFIDRSAAAEKDVSDGATNNVARRRLIIAGVILLGGIAGLSFSRVWTDRRGIERTAKAIRDTTHRRDDETLPHTPVVIDVYGEPALFMQLSAARAEFVSAVQSVHDTPVTANGLPMPTFLAVGPHARRSPNFANELLTIQQFYKHVGNFSFRPSPLMLLDNYSPAELTNRTIEETIELYRYRDR